MSFRQRRPLARAAMRWRRARLARPARRAGMDGVPRVRRRLFHPPGGGPPDGLPVLADGHDPRPQDGHDGCAGDRICRQPVLGAEPSRDVLPHHGRAVRRLSHPRIVDRLRPREGWRGDLEPDAHDQLRGGSLPRLHVRQRRRPGDDQARFQQHIVQRHGVPAGDHRRAAVRPHEQWLVDRLLDADRHGWVHDSPADHLLDAGKGRARLRRDLHAGGDDRRADRTDVRHGRPDDAGDGRHGAADRRPCLRDRLPDRRRSIHDRGPRGDGTDRGPSRALRDREPHAAPLQPARWGRGFGMPGRSADRRPDSGRAPRGGRGVRARSPRRPVFPTGGRRTALTTRVSEPPRRRSATRRPSCGTSTRSTGSRPRTAARRRGR